MKRTGPKKSISKKEKDLMKKIYTQDEDSQDSDDQVWDQSTQENLELYLKQQKYRAKKNILDKKTLNIKYLQTLAKSGEYWCLGRLIFLLKKFLAKDLMNIYLDSIKYKLNLQKQILILERVKFAARELKSSDIRIPPKDQEAHWRQGYAIAELAEFYDLLKNQNLLMRSVKDFKLLILPIFYLLHGEAFDSDDPSTMSSYFINPSKSQCNIVCKKCRINKCNTAQYEFLYHNTDYNKAAKTYEPTDITVNTRGTPFNSLHYLGTHGYYGQVPKYDSNGLISKWDKQPLGTYINGQQIESKQSERETIPTEPKLSSMGMNQYGQVTASSGQKRTYNELYEMEIKRIAKDYGYGDYEFSSDEEQVGSQISRSDFGPSKMQKFQ